MSLMVIGIILLNVVILILIFKSINDYNVSQEMDSQIQILSSNDVLLQDQKKKTDDFISTMNQDMEIMRNAANNGQTEELKAYYAKALNSIYQNEDEDSKVLAGLNGLSSNALKGLIISKKVMAQNQGVNFEVGIIGALSHIPMDEIDLCRSVGILLDNAIEAALESEYKEVSLMIGKGLGAVDELWQIKIRNTHNGQLKNFSSKMHSTKGVGRGIGMKSLNAIISKYSEVRLVTDYSKSHIEVALEFYCNMTSVRIYD